MSCEDELDVGATIERAEDAALDAAREMNNINDGILKAVAPPSLEFDFDIFKEQLVLETFDYEGIRRRFELYSALRRYTRLTKADCWNRAFGSKQRVWELVRLGLGYLCKCTIKKARDMPLLASRYLPFCNTFGCEFRKGGCLFSICEDIIGLFDVILCEAPEDLKADFENNVLRGLGDSLDAIYEPVVKALQTNGGLPYSLSSRSKKIDPYITLKFISNLLRMPFKYDIPGLEGIIRQCYDDSMESALYFPMDRRRTLIDDSPTLYLRIGSLLSMISSLMDIRDDAFERFMEQRKSNALIILVRQKPADLIGPTYGRDRYAAIGWSTQSDIPTVLGALEFLVDVEDFRLSQGTVLHAGRRDEDKKAITKGVCKGLEYLTDLRIRDLHIWPVVNLQKMEDFNPDPARKSYWNGIRETDKRLTDYPDSFNISFSNTVDSVVMLLRGVDYLRKLQGESGM